MTYNNPRKLSNIAAKVFVEDLILDSPFFHNFHSFKELSCADINHYGNEKDMFKCELFELKTILMQIITQMDIVFKDCNEKMMVSICQELRTTDHLCTSGTLILQLLYDTEINFRRRHWQLFPVLLVIECRFTSIQKLIFDTSDINSTTVLGQLIKFLPNLKVFKGEISKDGKCLNALRKNCHNMRDLGLYVNEGYFTSNQLTAFFFCGKHIDFVKKAYVKLESIPLTFPSLHSFSINGITYEQYDFFKMFLHFYTNVHLDAALHYSHYNLNAVSWFDAVLSHSVVISPELQIKECDINIHDLFLPYFEKCLGNWKNLQSLNINLGIQGKKNPATSTNIGKKLEQILSKMQNVKEFCIKVQGQIGKDEVSEIIFPALKTHGKRFRQLKIVGVLHYLSHRSLVQAINFCPNLNHLVLIGKRIAKYFKDVELITLPKLRSLTIIWAECQTNNTYCQWNSKVSSDLIKNSPNLRRLFITANIFLLDFMCKMKFGFQLENLIIFLHTEKPLEGVEQFKKFLPNLPKLRQLVLKEPENDHICTCYINGGQEECICDDRMENVFYSEIKKIVDNTQIFLRYYSLEDADTNIHL